MGATQMLSEHFSLDEMTVTQEGDRAGLDNTPGEAEIANLQRLCRVLEGVRTLLGVPIIVTSGYRSPEVNKLVGGAPTSAHMKGLAADIIAPRYGTPIEVAKAITQSGILFDQTIHEFGRWCHLAIPGTLPARRQILTIDTKGARYGLLPTRTA